MLANEKRRRRRESHNAVERRRRDNINEKISELATLIPECMLDPSGESRLFECVAGVLRRVVRDGYAAVSCEGVAGVVRNVLAVRDARRDPCLEMRYDYERP